MSAPARLAELQERAVRLDLAASPAWRALGHYEADWQGSGVHSTVASERFFLSPDGRYDPGAELDATLTAFVSGRRIETLQKPAACVFVARRRFLTQHLGLAKDALSDENCDEYRQWRQALGAVRVSLIFPTAFPNSPSSMFGHTLLRVDSARTAPGTELLSYAVNFAAAAGDDGKGLGFAWKGLTGGYPGVFGVFPYYKKVKQYAWIEHRDIWSYPLELKPVEIDRLVDHLWEMDNVRFAYYFLIKNCSYQLLSLLEVARPTLRLTQQFSWYAIPVDTIRSLADVPELMGTPRYRPSLETTLRWEADQLDTGQRALALSVASGEIGLEDSRMAGLSPHDHAAVLEVAHDYLYYRLQSAPEDMRVGAQRANAILLARSRISRPSSFGPVPEPVVSPAQGHPTIRFATSVVYEAHDFSRSVRLRPAYHDLLDDPGGYTDGAQINFLDLGLRFDLFDADFRIEDLRLLDIVSLSPRDDLFKPVSFQIDTGLRRRPSSNVFDDVDNNLGYYLEAGPGLAWGDSKLLGYGFGLGSIDANSALSPGYAVGAGASAGVLAYPLRRLRLKAEIGALSYVAGDDGYYRWAKFQQQVDIFRDLGLRGEIGWENTAVDSGMRAVIGLQAYF